MIDDFDAVSLYPSAMKRLKQDGYGLPTGKPHLFNNEVDMWKYPSFYAKIKVKDIKRKRSFPLQSVKVVVDDTEKRMFDDDRIIGNVIYLDRIALEDFI